MVSIKSSSLRQLSHNAQNSRRYPFCCSSGAVRRTPSRFSFTSIAWLLVFCLLLVGSSLLVLDRNVHSPSQSSLLNVTITSTKNDSVEEEATNRIRTSPSSFEKVAHWRRIVVLLSDGKVEESSSSEIMKNTITGAATRTGRKVIPMSPLDSEEETGDYKDGLPDPLETEECQVQYQWQKDSKPTCNVVHELDMNAFYFDIAKHRSPENNKKKKKLPSGEKEEKLRLVASGGWRDVWAFYPKLFKLPYILKTLRYDIEVVPRNIDRHRRDALVMERLSSSPNIVDLYSFCGNSGFTAFADGGDIERAVDEMNKAWPSPKVKLERLHIAVQAAMGLADLHNFDKEGRPSVAHTDISLGQFVKVQGRFMLNDFNRARFLSENRKTKEICPYHLGSNPGSFRSPEEYLYLPQTEKVDVYSLGNIFFTLLTLEEVFQGMSGKKVKKRVKKGERPIPVDIHGVWNSTDPIDQALKAAMEMCFIFNVTERATARQVETFLKRKLEEIDPGRLESWGVKHI